MKIRKDSAALTALKARMPEWFCLCCWWWCQVQDAWTTVPSWRTQGGC